MKKNIMFAFFILGLFVLFLVYRQHPLDSNPRTIQKVAKKAFNGPNAQLITDSYSSYFTPQAFETFVQQKYANKYHLLAHAAHKTIMLEAVTVTKDFSSPIIYHFDLRLLVTDLSSKSIHLTVSGDAQFVEHKIVAIHFLDDDLLQHLE
ncbi:MAG: hypothetical protein RR448_04410 [Niameybacter sp.]|uniref:hypothetical protein n=1 Tax=Niameybacter sp. TaxID=2033640 RepID=UPI002FC9432C